MARFAFRFAVFATLVVVAGALSAELGFLSFNRPAHLRYSVRGLDVSHHQGAIDWRTVRNENVDFVFIKATEGVDWIDPRFDENWSGAEAAGIALGAYHFFRFCKPGEEQAAHFLATVPPESNTLPPAVDVEYTGNCGRRNSTEAIRGELETFIEIVSETYGRTALIYADSDAYRRIIAGHFVDVPLWIPTLGDQPDLNDGRDWTFWQHTDRGEIAGITGHVDLNVFAGSRRTFGRLVD